MFRSTSMPTSGSDDRPDIPVTILGKRRRLAAGKINGGGPKLVLRSSGEHPAAEL
jgi:hypothetical protein